MLGGVHDRQSGYRAARYQCVCGCILGEDERICSTYPSVHELPGAGAVFTGSEERSLENFRTIKVSQSYVESLELFWQKAEEVRGVPVDSIVCEDPDDQKFLEAALGGQTDFLVTNDDHLLRLGHIGRAEILTPGSVVRVLGI